MGKLRGGLVKYSELKNYFICIFRAQKKTIQNVPMERCKSRLTRCKKLAACNKERNAGVVKPSKSDYMCGSDSKTYKTECDLAHATCL